MGKAPAVCQCGGPGFTQLLYAEGITPYSPGLRGFASYPGFRCGASSTPKGLRPYNLWTQTDYYMGVTPSG